MAKTNHARRIGPWRSSGLNQPGYSRPPQSAAEPSEDLAVSLGTSRAPQRVQRRLEAAQGLILGDPPRVDPATACATVHLDGEPFRVPLGWHVAFSSRRGRDALYVLDDRRGFHVLIVDSEGQIRELQGLPADLSEDLRRAHFPRGPR